MDTKFIYEALYNMLILANTRLDSSVYSALFASDFKDKNKILNNAYLAYKNSRPLCQDTGQVVVFLKVGQEIKLEGEFINDIINKAVKDCYKDNFYRKSVVKDALFDRTNTETNTPCVIHTTFQKGDEISLLCAIKGGGAENMTKLKMMNPTSTEEEVFDFVKETVLEAKDNACPPVSVGIGVGGTAEVACLLAKYALFKGKKIDLSLENVIETKILTAPSHIACMSVCVNLNCHSSRHFECVIKNGEVRYDFNDYTPEKITDKKEGLEISTKDKEAFKKLKKNDKILLTGKIYTARDMAHKKLVELINRKKNLPFDLEGSIIFYAGPCPKNDSEIIGPIGPTTSKRMDKFAPILYENGVFATIGKGERTISGGNRLYLKATGGVACLYQNCVKSARIAAFSELGTEAVYELEVDKMPLVVDFI